VDCPFFSNLDFPKIDFPKLNFQSGIFNKMHLKQMEQSSPDYYLSQFTRVDDFVKLLLVVLFAEKDILLYCGRKDPGLLRDIEHSAVCVDRASYAWQFP
jgi:hypothetical protein